MRQVFSRKNQVNHLPFRSNRFVLLSNLVKPRPIDIDKMNAQIDQYLRKLLFIKRIGSKSVAISLKNRILSPKHFCAHSFASRESITSREISRLVLTKWCHQRVYPYAKKPEIRAFLVRLFTARHVNDQSLWTSMPLDVYPALRFVRNHCEMRKRVAWVTCPWAGSRAPGLQTQSAPTTPGWTAGWMGQLPSTTLKQRWWRRWKMWCSSV